MKSMHLFAGIGGGLLADLILGHEPVIALENDPYAAAVLRERSAEWFPNLRVLEYDIRLWDPSDEECGVDIIHAGFPCQPHSVAGKRAGENDERNLWPDTRRIVGRVRPRFVYLENVAGIVSNGFIATVVGDLAALGYDARWAIVSAADAGAPHRRDRWWCLAERMADTTGVCEREQSLDPGAVAARYSGATGNAAPCGSSAGTNGRPSEVSDPDRADLRQQSGRVDGPGRAGAPLPRVDGAAEFVADSERERGRSGNPEGQDATNARQRSEGERNDPGTVGWWSIEPEVGRVAHGVPARVQRLRGLGNAQVPQAAALAWLMLGGPVNW